MCIAPFLRFLPLNFKKKLPYPNRLPPFRIRGCRIWVGFGLQVAKTLINSDMSRIPFLLHFMITIHQRFRQTDGRTDVILVG